MANISLNRIDVEFDPVDKAKIEAAYDVINDVLDKYAKALTDTERKELSSIDVDNKVFCDDTLDQSSLVKADLNPEGQSMVTRLDKDLNFWDVVNKLYEGRHRQIGQRLEDTRRLVAHESFAGANGLYAIIETFAKMGIEGFQSPYDILKERYQKNGGGGNPGNDNP